MRACNVLGLSTCIKQAERQFPSALCHHEVGTHPCSAEKVTHTHTNVLQSGQLKFISFSGRPPVSNLLLTSTQMASDRIVAEITPSMDEMLILTMPSGQTCPWGDQRSDQRLFDL